MPNKELTTEAGIKIQAAHLREIKRILKKKVYDALEAWAKETNSNAKTGYDIRRGTDLQNFVANFYPSERIEY